jgi:hypothetical protein
MFLRLPLVSILLLAPFIAAAQTSQNTSAQNTPYTFHADTRVVLTDVTVTDSKGNPVHGLPQSAFRIFDNNQPQAVASFEEHTATTQPSVLPATASTATTTSSICRPR